jgi:hypothetical protein
MMSFTATILADADAALSAALVGEPHARLRAMADFMESVERLWHEAAQGGASWEDARPWARANAERLRSAREALDDWELDLGHLFYTGGEEETERALMRRSQHSLARDLFRGTSVDDLLAGYEAEDVDADFRAKAELVALDGPSWLPRTHTWWRWRRTP